MTHVTFGRDSLRLWEVVNIRLNTRAVTERSDWGHCAANMRARESSGKRGIAMPILMVALLALLVFGLIGILLSAAVILENSKGMTPAKSSNVHPLHSGVPPSLNTKLR